MINTNILKSNARHFGLSFCLILGCEECSELLKELEKPKIDIDNLIEECADTYICLSSIRYLENLGVHKYNNSGNNYRNVCLDYIKYSIKRLRCFNKDETLRMSKSDVHSKFSNSVYDMCNLINSLVNTYGKEDEFEELVNSKLNRTLSMIDKNDCEKKFLYESLQLSTGILLFWMIICPIAGMLTALDIMPYEYYTVVNIGYFAIYTLGFIIMYRRYSIDGLRFRIFGWSLILYLIIVLIHASFLFSIL